MNPSGLSLYYLDNDSVSPEGLHFYRQEGAARVSSNLTSVFTDDDFSFAYYNDDSYLVSFPLFTTSNVDETIATISFITETSVTSSIVLESFVSSVNVVDETIFKHIKLLPLTNFI